MHDGSYRAIIWREVKINNYQAKLIIGKSYDGQLWVKMCAYFCMVCVQLFVSLAALCSPQAHRTVPSYLFRKPMNMTPGASSLDLQHRI